MATKISENEDLEYYSTLLCAVDRLVHRLARGSPTPPLRVTKRSAVWRSPKNGAGR